MLALTKVFSYYGSSPVIQEVSFAVRKGTIAGVLGRNGVGKTTLLRTIMGLTDKVEGSIEFDGEELTKRPTFARARRGIGYIPQGREIIGTFTVVENLKLGIFGRSDGERSIPAFVFEMFPVLKEMGGRKGGDLSGGQQQQLAIARALCLNPRLLLLDEPTEGIQPNIVAELEQTIVRLNKELDITILLVEQNIGFIKRSCSQVLIMDKGSLAYDGGVDELSDSKIREHMTV